MHLLWFKKVQSAQDLFSTNECEQCITETLLETTEHKTTVRRDQQKQLLDSGEPLTSNGFRDLTHLIFCKCHGFFFLASIKISFHVFPSGGSDICRLRCIGHADWWLTRDYITLGMTNRTDLNRQNATSASFTPMPTDCEFMFAVHK